MSDNNELSEVFNAKLVRNNIVFDSDIESDLFNKGYGEKNDKKIIFADYEILFLVYIGKLNVLYRKKKLSFHNSSPVRLTRRTFEVKLHVVGLLAHVS